MKNTTTLQETIARIRSKYNNSNNIDIRKLVGAVMAGDLANSFKCKK